jgi:putative transposase
MGRASVSGHAKLPTGGQWAEGRRYLGLDILAKSRLHLVPGTGNEVITEPALELSA